MMFACIQPKSLKKIPADKKYFRMTRMCVRSLISTGFPKDNILCIFENLDHAEFMQNNYGVKSMVCDSIPTEMSLAVSKHVQNYFFYKPVSFFKCVPNPISTDTVMAFCDVDALFISDPRNLLLSQNADIWASRGDSLPRDPDNKFKNPKRNYGEISRFLENAGNGAIAHLILKYNISIPKEILYSGLVAIKPHVYSKVIETWYNMCLEVMTRDDLTRGDQEVLSAAIWHLGISYTRSTKKFTRKVCKQYGGLGRKSEMMRDFKKRFGSL